jgi:hypothetical protein
MNSRILGAALVATAFVVQVTAARAGCVIAPDGKSIDVVTDNGSRDEKTCSVACQVDTKIGVVNVGCGGTTPPLAKGHSLCAFDKPEVWYKKVVSSEDSCKGAAAGAAPALPAPVAAVKPGTFICRISADGLSFDAMIANPYAAEASCQVNCKISTTQAGTTEQSSCTKNVAPGVGEVVLCTHTVDKGKLVKVVGGSGECFDPTPKPTAADKDDEGIDVEKLANQPMPKPSAAAKADEEELKKIGDDPVKLQEFMDKKMDAAMKKAFGK